MKLLPSAAVRVAGSGELVSWGFLGPDASLTSLHVEVSFAFRSYLCLPWLEIQRDYQGGAKVTSNRKSTEAKASLKLSL